jgi:hypothetical protein
LFLPDVVHLWRSCTGGGLIDPLTALLRFLH